MNRICTEPRTRRQWTLAIMLCWTFTLGAHPVAVKWHNVQSDGAVLPYKVTLKEVLNDLEKHYNITFVYEYGIVSDRQVVAEVRYRTQLEATLNELLPPLGLRFKKINDRTYAISRADLKKTKERFESSLFRVSAIVSIRVSGTVTDENNRSLPGVNVVEKGTTNGTTTDTDERFNLDVQDEQSVLARRYENQPYTYPNNDWFDMFDPGLIQEHNLQFAGC